MIPSGLAAALTVFDEAALILLANKGLVRRAARDVAEGMAAIQDANAETVTVTCDGDTVRLDRRGPAFAICTCPAPGVCRHRLAAVLFVQSQTMTDTTEAVTVGSGAETDVAALPLDDLRKWAGKANWRAALELAEGGADVVPDAQGFSVTFPDEGPVVRILTGLGPEGMVSKTAPAGRKAVHTAAWLVVRAHLTLDAPGDSPRDFAVAQTELTGVAPEFLDAVTATLEDVLRLGFNLAPESLEERLFLLSVSSRADALPRLAALLRTLSAQIRSRRRRDFAFDPDRCLETVSAAFLLVSALRGVGETTPPDLRDMLFGQSRRAYASGGTLHIVGCGTDVWTTPSGARGVTGYFYEPAADRWLTASLMRGANQDPGFDPVRAYERESLWSGRTLKDLAHAGIHLDKAQVSDDGRLSAASGVAVMSIQARNLIDIEAWPCLFDDWQALEARLTSRASSGRGELVLLRPAALARPEFDDLSQVLTWPVQDKKGRWVALSLEHGRDRAATLDALQKAAESGWSGVIVALGSIEGRHFRLRPVALIDNDKGYNPGLDDFDTLTRDGIGRKTTSWLRDMKAAFGQTPKAFVRLPPSQASQTVKAVWQSLLDALEIGPGQAMRIVSGHLERHAQNLHNVGFPTLGDVVGKCARVESADAPGAFLKAAAALSLSRRLMIGLPYLKGQK
ncbi:hypothetical protein [Asticcacaulis sp. YBE204]|uniref:hypothetical protein n=1 Tax=Asticcacaulis sp. YBE204 TaxID=1282363 RepID=UPI0003C4028E|nr:hypothetical protein [Asticcacaulis sp. YBE204]ESQ80360.1 hypothetical protein AEYBE204_03605 [Asticcacaulis sp. YBE204]